MYMGVVYGVCLGNDMCFILPEEQQSGYCNIVSTSPIHNQIYSIFFYFGSSPIVSEK